MTHFEAFEDLDGRWRWRLIAASGEVVASSGRSFDSHADAVRTARAVKRHAADAYVAIEPGVGVKALLRLRALVQGEPEEAAARQAGSRRRMASDRGRKGGGVSRRGPSAVGRH